MIYDPQQLAKAFFIMNPEDYTSVSGVYDLKLVALSYVIAVLASYIGVRISEKLYRSSGRKRRNLIHTCGSLALGIGIWSMHFIGMIAYKMDMVHTYNPVLTVVSMIFAVVAGWGVLLIIRKGDLTLKGLSVGALLLGIAICGMHYIGMAAMDMKAALVYKPGLFALSVVIAVVASAAALGIIFNLVKNREKYIFLKECLAAMVMGAAICGMHYTGVEAAVFVPFADCQFDPHQSYDILAFFVAIASSIVFAFAITLSLQREESEALDTAKGYSGQVVFVQLSALLSLLLVVIVGSYYFYTNGFKQQSYSKKLLVAVGIEHIFVADIKKAADIIKNAERDGVNTEELERQWRRIKERVARVEQNFESVLTGGDFFSEIEGDKTEYLTPLKNSDVIDQIYKSQRLWVEFKKALFLPYDYQTLQQDTSTDLSDTYDELLKTHAATIEAVQAYNRESTSNLFLRQILLLSLGVLTFIVTLVYARFFIANPIDRVRAALQKSKDDLERRVEEQTKDLRLAKENAERLNGRMQEYTDKLEVLRTEAVEERDKAEKASQAKSDFLANMSHELRTPLNSILGLSRMLVDDLEEETEEQFMAETVYNASSNLLQIVNDILDLSKIEAGEIILEEIGFDFRTVVSAVVETLAPIASSRGVSLNYIYSGDELPYLVGDPVRTNRILTNLIGNAVKYTNDGTVNVNVKFTKKGTKTGVLHCSIVDTGVGIPKDKQEDIFKKFTQADETTTRKFGGTGLGLSITKELVELMDGDIGVESEVGKGSEFWFNIPFETTDDLHVEMKSSNAIEEGKRAKNRPCISGASVLVAEDHELNQAFIKKILKNLDVKSYETVDNGHDALEQYKSGQYDLILMDCHMPGKNGYDTATNIRQCEVGTGKHIPIVALTADAMRGTRERCIEAGMDEYIAKPIDLDDFKAVLSQWFELEGDDDYSAEDVDDKKGEYDFSTIDLYAETAEELRNYCDMFFEKSEAALVDLKENCKPGVNEDWVEIAHKLKGSSAMMGAIRMKNLCAEAQDMRKATKKARIEKLKEIKEAYKDAKVVYIKKIENY